ncbi:MAG: GTP cyclohydrolase I FolE [Candidatus Zixiibacteriota bacterium]|nr:MAG: GTP cyclohydrolase I FolE [candidate division Zixibacteria bacterium]HHI02683.1 GTP cyclohydrolase I FolE [candidate division Zixibacteria bacterium]
MKSQKRNRHRRSMDKDKITRGVHLILEGIGEDPKREGLKRTPERVFEFYKEFLSGIKTKPEKTLKLYTTPNKDELIIVKDIAFYSMCEHHLLPFFGKAHIAYIPQENKITGFSHLVKIVETLAHRPTVQEELTSNIADTILKVVGPKGLLVIIEAEHLCLTMIGVKKTGSRTVTSAVRGILRKQATRAEAMSLINK